MNGFIFEILLASWLELLAHSGPSGCYLGWRFNARNRCTIDTAVAPSPTAAAHLLTELWRTSPAANSPGILVSINIGFREREAQYEGGSGSSIRSSPVRMYPAASVS